MRNKALPHLLRAIANSENAKDAGHSLIFNEAIEELNKLDKLQALADDWKKYHNVEIVNCGIKIDRILKDID